MPLLLAVLTIGVLFSLSTALPHLHRKSQRDHQTQAALQAAKQALLGYAAADSNQPGNLPCPSNSGTSPGIASNSGSNCASYLGRLPWKTLGLPELRDASGSCLWYALAPASLYRSALGVSSRSVSKALNSNTPGGLTVVNAQGQILSNDVVAVIIAPSEPVSGKTHNEPRCGGSDSPANYLDIGPNGVDNASNGSTFVTAPASATFNDNIRYISRSELFAVVGQRIAADLRGYAGKGLIGYAAAYGQLPCAAGANGLQSPGLVGGLLPIEDPDISYDSVTKRWFDNNNWFSLITYAPSDCTHPLTTDTKATFTILGKSYQPPIQ